ncbi:MAG: hypothetical protein ABI823_02170 [Bryobacteraceae bacterium]
MEFETAIQALCDAGVDFVVIGGLSATLHGSAAITFDLDIFYARTQSNLRRIVAALEPYHPRPREFPPGLPFVWDEATVRNGSMLTLHTDAGDVDLLAEVAGLDSFDAVKATAIEVQAFGRRICILDLPSLIRAKRAAGRPKDLLALPELESLNDAGGG